MTSGASGLPPGWYMFSEHGTDERYWDGTDWTQHYRPHPQLADADAVAGMTTSVGASHADPPAPGWYPDPSTGGQLRWWDGMRFSPVPYPAAGPTTITVNVRNGKSVGVAFLLAFFFHAFGLLYATAVGGLIMLAVTFFGGILVGVASFGFALGPWLFVCWVASVVWACVAASGGGGSTTVVASR